MMDALKKAFRAGIRKDATRSVNDGGLGLTDRDEIDRYVDIVEKEADLLAAQLAVGTGGEMDKAAANTEVDQLGSYLLKRAGQFMRDAQRTVKSMDKEASSVKTKALGYLSKLLRGAGDVGGSAASGVRRAKGSLGDLLGALKDVPGRARGAAGDLAGRAGQRAHDIADAGIDRMVRGAQGAQSAYGDVADVYGDAGEAVADIARRKGMSLANKAPIGRGTILGLSNRITPSRATKGLVAASAAGGAAPPAAIGATYLLMQGGNPDEVDEAQLAEIGEQVKEEGLEEDVSRAAQEMEADMAGSDLGMRGLGAAGGGLAGYAAGRGLGLGGLGQGALAALGGAGGAAAPEIADLLSGEGSA